jgi:very-short-patch-repair endonuclease
MPPPDPPRATRTERRRQLRREATPAEQVLWQLLRGRQVAGAKVRRQHQCGPYILDFFCPARRLAFEADGEQHFTDAARADDQERSAYLAARRIRVVRFTNREILAEPPRVAAIIGALLAGGDERSDAAARPPRPGRSRWERGRRCRREPALLPCARSLRLTWGRHVTEHSEQRRHAEHTILDQIDLGAIALPEFQRGYVWNREQVRGLMWSLYKKHPVGGLLVWATKTESAPARGDGPLAPGSVKLLLDGQQRITTLYGIIRGKPPRFFDGNADTFTGLYFHLEDETFEFYAPLRMKDNPLWVDVTALMQAGIGPFTQRLLAAPDLLPRLNTYINRLSAVVTIKDVDLHIEEVSGEDKTVDVVVDIFNRVNSGGTKLSKGDLALAKVCAEWPQARDAMKQRLAKWKAAGFDFRLEWLLRVINAIVRCARPTFAHLNPLGLWASSVTGGAPGRAPAAPGPRGSRRSVRHPGALDERDGVGGGALAPADEAHPLAGGGLDADRARRHAERAGEPRPHRRDVRRQPGTLHHHRRVDVADAPAVLAEQRHHPGEQVQAVGIPPARVGGREMVADVAQRRRAEQRVHDRVGQHVGVGVTEQPDRRGQFDAAQHQPPPRRVTVDVIAEADAHQPSPFSRRPAVGRGRRMRRLHRRLRRYHETDRRCPLPATPCRPARRAAAPRR